MRKLWLLLVSFGMAGCLMTLLLSRNGILLCGNQNAETETNCLQTRPAPVAARTEKKKITFPHSVAGTDLKIVRLSEYEGPLAGEDSHKNVFHAAALEIENTGSKTLRTASVTLQAENQTLEFSLSFLPPGSRILVQEKNGQIYNGKAIQTAAGQVTTADTDLTPEGLQIEDVTMGATKITNTLDRKRKDLQLYYKSALGTEPLYLGGETYTYRIAELEPGESVVLDLPNYAMGYSRIVATEE